MPKPDIVFFGTHNFAAKILLGLLESPDFNIGLVVTQPDQITGRKKILQPPPVKLVAEKFNLPIRQPDKLKDLADDLSKFTVGVVAQYGKIIPSRLLEMPKKGMLNVHASLLPKYRGASPIQFALLKGEEKTGVTIMKMDEGVDTGPILTQEEIKITANDTYLILEERLAILSAPLLLTSLKNYLAGTQKPQNQDETKATYTKILTKNDGLVDFKKTARDIYNQWRAFLPWPGSFFETEINQQKIKIKLLEIALTKSTSEAAPKTLIKITKNRLGIVCGDKKILEILELQPENRNIVKAVDFINGYKIA